MTKKSTTKRYPAKGPYIVKTQSLMTEGQREHIRRAAERLRKRD